jgi:hypothetical protein
MRKEVEDCLPPELDIEKTVILGQFFLINAARGAEIENDNIPVELIFEEYNAKQDYGKPVINEFDRNSPFGQAFGELAMSSKDIDKLIDGLFLLKSNVVDYDRLSEARHEMSEDFQSYIDAALAIDTAELADAYKIGTTRNNADSKLSTLLDRISNYAAELERLTAEEDASHIQEALEPIEKWYDPSHTAHDLAEWFDTLYDCAGSLGVTTKQSYDEAHSILTESPRNIDLKSFKEDVKKFQNMDDAKGVELIARLHDYSRSREDLKAWEIYEAFDSLISDLKQEDHETGSDLESSIKKLDGYSDYEQKRQEIISLTEEL